MDIIKTVIEKFFEKLEGNFLLRWVLPFLLILIGTIGVLLLHPPHPLEADISLSGFPGYTRPAIAIATLTSFVSGILLLTFYGLYSVTESRSSSARSAKAEEKIRKFREDLLGEIDNLGPDELVLLAICLHRNTQVFNAPVNNNIVAKLAQRGLFLPARAGFVDVLNFPYQLNPHFWKVLKDNQDLIYNKTGILGATEEQINAVWAKLTF